MNKLVIAALIFLCTLVGCSNKTATGPTITGAYAKAMPPGQSTSAAYMLIDNTLDKDLVINHIVAGIAGQVEVHRMTHEDGMMKMRHVKHMVIPSKSKLALEPGGLHLMLMDVAETLEKGKKFDMTIEFEGGVKVTFPVDVR